MAAAVRFGYSQQAADQKRNEIDRALGAILNRGRHMQGLVPASSLASDRIDALLEEFTEVAMDLRDLIEGRTDPEAQG